MDSLINKRLQTKFNSFSNYLTSSYTHEQVQMGFSFGT